MSVSSLKISFLYYKHLLDLAIVKFVDDFNDSFTKMDDGSYLFSSDVSRIKVKKYFLDAIESKVVELAGIWDEKNPRCLVIIGSCVPKDNILLSFRDKSDYFPDKLDTILEKMPSVRWILREKDIKFDLLELNSILIEVFDDLFKRSADSKAKRKQSLKNVMFVSHKNLDCYATFKILKWMYGRSATVNLYEETKLNTKTLPLIAINDLLGKYVRNRVAMNKSADFKRCAREVKHFVDWWMTDLLT